MEAAAVLSQCEIISPFIGAKISLCDWQILSASVLFCIGLSGQVAWYIRNSAYFNFRVGIGNTFAVIFFMIFIIIYTIDNLNLWPLVSLILEKTQEYAQETVAKYQYYPSLAFNLFKNETSFGQKIVLLLLVILHFFISSDVIPVDIPSGKSYEIDHLVELFFIRMFLLASIMLSYLSTIVIPGRSSIVTLIIISEFILYHAAKFIDIREMHAYNTDYTYGNDRIIVRLNFRMREYVSFRLKSNYERIQSSIVAAIAAMAGLTGFFIG